MIVFAVELAWSAGRRHVSVLVVLQLATAAAAAASLLVLRELFHEIGDRDSLGATAAVVVMAALTAILVGAGALHGQHQTLLSQLATAAATRRLMRKAATTDPEAFDRAEFQEWLRRAYFAALSRPVVVTGSLTTAARSAFGLVLVGSAIAVMSPLVLVAALATRIPAWFVNVSLSRSSYQVWRSTTELEQQRSYMASLFSTASTMREIRLYGTEEFFLDKYSTLSEELLAVVRQRLRNDSAYSSMSTAASAVGTAIVYGAISLLAVTGHIDLATGVALLVGVGQFAGHSNALVAAFGGVYDSVLYLEDAVSFLSPISGSGLARRSLTTAPSRIQIDGLTFAYRHWDADRATVAGPEIVRALEGVSCNFARGEVVAIVGANGSGKSTLAKVLCGAYTPQAGVITVDGRAVDVDWLRANTAVVFQDFARYMLSARENIALGSLDAEPQTDRIERAASAAGAHEFLSELPSGYDTLLGSLHRSGRELSFGQWQRLGLARAIFRGAGILILDEPTAALDPRAEQTVLRHIRDAAEHSAVLVISHRTSTVAAADRIYVLDRGRVIEEGTHDQLFRVGSAYHSLFGRAIDDASVASSRSRMHVSEREAQVLILCRAGLTDKEVAYRLGISTPTVRTVLQRFYEREGFRNRTQAVAAFVEAGMSSSAQTSSDVGNGDVATVTSSQA